MTRVMRADGSVIDDPLFVWAAGGRHAADELDEPISVRHRCHCTTGRKQCALQMDAEDMLCYACRTYCIWTNNER